MDQDVKYDLLARAACLLFPIQWDEPFGLVMTEALACGTPVVAFRRGSVPEIVEDGVTGYVGEEPSDLPDAIRRVGDIDPAACRDRAASMFDVDVMVSGYERAYRRAVAEMAERPGGAD